MRRFAAFFFVVASLFPATVFASVRSPARNGDVDTFVPMENEFASALVVDSATGKELYSFKPTKIWPAASLTKLMGAMVFLDRKPNLDRIVAMTSRDEVGGGRLRVSSGAKMSIQDLVFSSIVGSANNAAQALSRLSGFSQKTFISKMNAKAKAIGLQSAKFYDPVGMDPRNVMTARDVSTLAKKAFSTPVLQNAASTASYAFSIRNQNVKKVITNTNKLLTDDNGLIVFGGKTGYLEESRHNLVTEFRGTAPDQARLIIVILGSPDTSTMFFTGKRLAEWAWNAYRWPSSSLVRASTK